MTTQAFDGARSMTIIAVPGAEYPAHQQLGAFAQLHERDARVLLADTDPIPVDAGLPAEWNVADESTTDFEDRVAVLLGLVDQESGAGHAVHLFGAGLGAGLCIAAAARRAHSVSSLTTLAGWIRSDSVIRENIELGIALWHKDPFLAQRYSSLLELSPQYRKNIGANYAPHIPVVPPADERTLRRLRAAHQLDVTDDAAAVTCPTLVIATTRDQKIAPEHSYEIFGAIDGAALARTQTGHGALIERLGHVYSTHARMVRGEIKKNDRIAAVQA